MIHKKKISLKREFFYNALLVNIFIILILGIAIGLFMFQNELNRAKLLISKENKVISNAIDGYFKKFRIMIDFLSNLESVRSGYKLSDEEVNKLALFYDNLKRADPDINYVYSGYFNNRLIIYDYTPPEGYVAMIRPWYIAALESAPNISRGIPYTEAKTKEWLISLSKALYDENGNIVGVLAIDTNIDKINNLINKRVSGYESLYSYIINYDLEIIFHPNKEFLFKNVNDLIDLPIKFEKMEGNFEYDFERMHKLAYYTKLESLGWTVITVINKSEIINNVITKILPPIFIAIIISSFLGFFISNTTIRKIILPLENLKTRVENIINGKFEKDEFVYTDNEIEIISKEIEKLTENELYKKNLELNELIKKLDEISIRDELTGLFNRRKIGEELENHFYLWKRYKRLFSIFIIDIDNFKYINDNFGHLQGDMVLKKTSDILINNLRSSDIISRWGGDEFLILLPETTLENAIEVAEKLRRLIEDSLIKENTKITISIGVATIQEQDSVDSILNRADNNLYKAKEIGKNKVIY